MVAAKSVGHPQPADYHGDRIQVGYAKLFWCGCASYRSFSVFLPNRKVRHHSFYFGSFHDHNGKPLEGGNNYRLHVPANVPVSEFWSITIYGLKTSGFFLNSTRLTLSSLDKELRKNAHGSVDIYIGPKPPAGQESNWLYTPAGEKWFPWFRVYGPEKAIMDKSWRLPDIERVS